MEEPTQGTHTALWEHSLRIWHFRNDAFQGDTNTQFKRYKLEELEREKHSSVKDTQNYKQYYITSNRNTLTPHIRLTTSDMTVRNVGQPSLKSFLTRLHPYYHPQTKDYYHGI
jgi:hypothetical protein